MLEFKNVIKRYPTPSGEDKIVLHDINLTIPSGESFGIIGESGAGKSTLLRLCNLLIRPTLGSIHFDDLDLTQCNLLDLNSHRRKIGMIFQQFNLLKTKTVLENISLPLLLSNDTSSSSQTYIKEVIERVGLSKLVNSYPSQLSGGQKQRVAIARALATKPKILLCDEPTSALDPETTEQTLSLLKDLNRELGITIVLISHEMEVIKKLCTKTAVMSQGKIIEQQDTYQLFYEPKQEITKELISHSLSLHVPEALKNYIFSSKKPVMQIIFDDTVVDKPIISNLILESNSQLNILQANMEYLNERLLGHMIFEIDAKHEVINTISKNLTKHGIKVELLNGI